MNEHASFGLFDNEKNNHVFFGLMSGIKISPSERTNERTNAFPDNTKFEVRVNCLISQQ